MSSTQRLYRGLKNEIVTRKIELKTKKWPEECANIIVVQMYVKIVGVYQYANIIDKGVNVEIVGVVRFANMERFETFVWIVEVVLFVNIIK